MTHIISALILGAVLFAIFERKRVRLLLHRFAESRHRASQEGSWHALAAALAEAGFFDRMTKDAAGRLRTEIETTGYRGVFSHPWRAVEADDEELAEGGVRVFLQAVAPLLNRLGVKPLVGESRFMPGGAHMLDLPGEVVTLVSAEEALEDDRDGGRLYGFSWGAVGARVLLRLNQELEAVGRSERFYSVYGGNDATALLLTPPMLAAILATPGIRPDELPYIRTTDWPRFGMREMPEPGP